MPKANPKFKIRAQRFHCRMKDGHTDSLIPINKHSIEFELVATSKDLFSTR